MLGVSELAFLIKVTHTLPQNKRRPVERLIVLDYVTVFVGVVGFFLHPNFGFLEGIRFGVMSLDESLFAGLLQCAVEGLG